MGRCCVLAPCRLVSMIEMDRILWIEILSIATVFKYNDKGLLNDTIANRGEKYVQPCGYEDLNQGRGQKLG